MKPSCEKKKRKLALLIREDAWYTFKVSVEFINEKQLKDRLQRFIDITQDPFAVEIRYCIKCWKKYCKKSVYEYSNRPDVEHIKNLYYQYVYNSIFEEHELRTLKCLTEDYKYMLKNLGLESDVKSGYVKDMLKKEFKDSIGFIANARK